MSELETCTGGALFVSITYHTVADRHGNILKIYIAKAWFFETMLKIFSLVCDINRMMPWRCGEVEEQLHIVLVLDVERWSASLVVWFASGENPGSNSIRYWVGPCTERCGEEICQCCCKKPNNYPARSLVTQLKSFWRCSAVYTGWFMRKSRNNGRLYYRSLWDKKIIWICA